MKRIVPLMVTLAATPLWADGTRQMHPHEHGVGQLNIAAAGGELVMEFTAPGADIVGFEHTANSDADHAAIDAATEVLERPLTLFVPNAEAACSVEHAHAGLDDDHDAHAGEHTHDHAHKDAHHDDAHHTEFHAEYHLDCEHPSALTTIQFAYFDLFENAREVDVQIVTSSGAAAFEVERDAPRLDVADLF